MYVTKLNYIYNYTNLINHIYHPGKQNVVAALSRRDEPALICFFVSVSTIKDWVKQCHVCQITKPSTFKPAGLLQPLPRPTSIWKEVSIYGLDHVSSNAHRKNNNIGGG